jgi:hypothetical protein
MEKNIPNLTQEQRVLKVLEDANGQWVSGNHFLRNMYLSQYHRAIHNLEHRDKINIEHSDFKDEFGFVSYRLPIKNTLF